MDIQENKEKIKLQFDIIKRTDGYISTTNNKAALLLAASGASLTIFSNKIGSFKGLFLGSNLYNLFFCVMVFLIGFFIVLSVVYSLRSIIPKMKSVNKVHEASGSLVSFVFIGNLNDVNEYFSKYNDEDDEGLLRDMCAQSYILAGIAKEKFLLFSDAVRYLKYAYFCMICLCFSKFVDFANGVLL
ncbi:Pycsar system effector family protein [Enterobacter sp. RHBSTW-00175]|uniref:Pycsar system effector family protein n=1 Tax=Enterobacter sp. RHBSTW-00175 TaxID=2742639 RepID=UPI0015EAE6D0|nr:Pycsar system effector family protein [Enterobacter sp. RHBSTW-00175]QMR74807.1 hypothetical protein HV107_03880 [Enterobacter sp. RHBSTW-00175]